MAKGVPVSTPANSRPEIAAAEAFASEAAATPNFSEIVSSAQARSAERAEQRRMRDRAIAEQEQRRWDSGVAFLNVKVRPMLERALQACVEEGIPAILEDNFAEKASAARLLFYCSSPVREQNGRPVLRGESDRLVLESDGTSLRAGKAKSFSTSPDSMRECEDIDEALTAFFSDVLESYFRSCEQCERHQRATGARGGQTDG